MREKVIIYLLLLMNILRIVRNENIVFRKIHINIIILLLLLTSVICCTEFLATRSRGMVSIPVATWSYLQEKVATSVQKTEISVVGIRRSDNTTPLYPQKLKLTLPTSGGRSVS
jgi:uncharacterized membrane protein